MKKYLLTGLIILLPVVLTIIILVFLFDFFTAPLVPLVKYLIDKLFIPLPESFITILSQLIALVLLCILIIGLGMAAQRFIFKKVVGLLQSIAKKIPLVGTVYSVCNDVFAALFSPDGKTLFKKTVMMPFPHPPHFCVGFQVGEVTEECQKKAGVPLVAVFAPTAPHPISGFLFLVPQKDVHDLDMSIEDGFKYLVSCGVIHPDIEKL